MAGVKSKFPLAISTKDPNKRMKIFERREPRDQFSKPLRATCSTCSRTMRPSLPTKKSANRRLSLYSTPNFDPRGIPNVCHSD